MTDMTANDTEAEARARLIGSPSETKYGPSASETAIFGPSGREYHFDAGDVDAGADEPGEWVPILARDAGFFENFDEFEVRAK